MATIAAARPVKSFRGFADCWKLAKKCCVPCAELTMAPVDPDALHRSARAVLGRSAVAQRD